MQSKNYILWMTGLSGAGKSTIAKKLLEFLKNNNHNAYILDGDVLREGLNSDLGFSDDDRKENVRRTGEVAKILYSANVTVIGALISPFRVDREKIRQLFPEDCFVEIYIDCPLRVCEQRDVKGLYAKVRKGEINSFTGIDSTYEKPLHPELHLRTDEMTVDECVLEITEYLKTLNTAAL